MDEEIRKWCKKIRKLGPEKASPTYWMMPDNDGELSPVELRPLQSVFLRTCFEHLDDTYFFILSAPKKVSKTFANALFVAWRMLAFPGSLTHLLANSKSQSARLVLSEITKMILKNPFLKKHTHITQNSLEFKPTGSKIICMAVAAEATAGANLDLLSASELWGCESDLEVNNWNESLPGPIKIAGADTCVFVDSYCGQLGQSETFHSLVDFGLQQKCIDEEWQIYHGNRILLCHITGAEMLQKVFHGTEEELQAWVDLNKRTKTPGKIKAHLYNERASGDFGISDEMWLPCFDADHQPLLPTKSKIITLSLDAASKAKTGDDVFLSGWYSENGLIKLALFKVWKGKDRQEEQDFEEIFNYVLYVAENWQVSKLLFDPYQLVSLGQRWSTAGILVQKVPQSKQQMGIRGSKYLQALREKRVVMYKHDDIIKANQGVKLVDQAEGGVLVKKSGTKKVDFVVSSVMAVSELADFSVPVPPEVLARATIELHQESAWKGGHSSWNIGRAGVGSKFRSPDRRRF